MRNPLSVMLWVTVQAQYRRTSARNGDRCSPAKIEQEMEDEGRKNTLFERPSMTTPYELFKATMSSTGDRIAAIRALYYVEDESDAAE